MDEWWLWILGKLVPQRHTIKWQMLESFAVLLILSIGLTYLICLSSMYALGSSTFAFGSSAVMTLVNDDLTAIANSVGLTVNKTLSIISESIVMSSAVYSYSLVNYNSLVMETQDSYKEYNFLNLGSCSPPLTSAPENVPSDFDELSTMSGSRFPSIAGFECGSLEHSSVYLAARTSTTQIDREASSTAWNALLAGDSRIQKVIDLLAIQDYDLKESYSKGPSETVMFYNSAILCPGGGDACDNTASTYTAIHRTYPGIYKALPSGVSDTYDPPGRSWFKKAPRSGVYLYGPYKESFTGQFVLTISSRSQSPATDYYSPSNSAANQLQMVSAAVLLLNSVSSVVSSIEYPKNGFGVLLTNTGGVWTPIVWRPGSATEFLYDASIDNGVGGFKPLSAIDAKLASALGANSLSSSKSFQYADPEGVEWIVSAVPFFPSTDATTGKSKLALVMLVFAKYSEVVTSIRTLESNIDKTTVSVLHTVLILAFGTAGLIAVVTYSTLAHSLAPLRSIVAVSKDVIQIAAEEEAAKDYSAVVNSAFFDINRRDEVGVLSTNFFQVVCLLHNTTVAKRHKPKCPVNPFHLAPLAVADTTDSSTAEKGGAAASSSSSSSSSPSSPLPSSPRGSYHSWAEYYAAWCTRQQELQRQSAAHADATAVLSSDQWVSKGKPETQPKPQHQHLDDLDVLGSMLAQERDAADHDSLATATATATATSASVSGDTRDYTMPRPTSDEPLAIEVGEFGVEMTPRGRHWLSSASSSSSPQQYQHHYQQPVDRVEARLDEVVPVLEQAPKLQFWQSIRVRVVLLCGLMYCALLAVMVVTVVTLESEGVGWMDATTKDIVASEHLQVDTLSALKSQFTRAYFKQITLNMAVYTATAWRVMDSAGGNLIKSTISSGAEGTSWLRSYALQYDPTTSTYSSSSGCPLDSTSCPTCVVSELSGYFSPSSTEATGLASDLCPDKTSLQAKQTGLLDFKSRSLFYRGSVLSNMGVGLPATDDGFYRQFPYKQVRRKDEAITGSRLPFARWVWLWLAKCLIEQTTLTSQSVRPASLPPSQNRLASTPPPIARWNQPRRRSARHTPPCAPLQPQARAHTPAGFPRAATGTNSPQPRPPPAPMCCSCTRESQASATTMWSLPSQRCTPEARLRAL